MERIYNISSKIIEQMFCEEEGVLSKFSVANEFEISEWLQEKGYIHENNTSCEIHITLAESQDGLWEEGEDRQTLNEILESERWRIEDNEGSFVEEYFDIDTAMEKFREFEDRLWEALK